MRRRAWGGFGVFVAAGAALATACDGSDSVVVVKVAAEGDVAGVTQLRAWVSNAGDGTARLFPTTPAAQPITFETSFSLSVPRERTGALDIALDGLGSTGVVVANGAGTVDLHVGDNVTVTITLRNGASLCGNRQLDDGEGCDDGDRLSTGACDYVCQPRTSGPGVGGRGGAGGTGGGGGGSAGTGGAAGTGGRPCKVELLASGGFDDSNTRWTQVTRSRQLIYDQASTPPLPSFVPAPQTPTRLAWLGYDADSDRPALRQSIQVPADTLQLNISGYFQIRTDEGSCECDKAFVELERPGGSGAMTIPLTQWNNQNFNNAWAYFSAVTNGAAVAGQSLTFQVRVEMDDDVDTSFYFDSLSVSADVCP